MQIYHAQLGSQELKLALPKCFCKNVGRLHLGSDIRERQIAGVKPLTYEMTVNLDMFRTFVENWILGDMKRSLTVTV